MKDLFGDKQWHQSLTAWGLILFSTLTGVEQVGWVPPGTAQSVVTFGQSLSGVMVVLGLRRAGTAKNVG